MFLKVVRRDPFMSFFEDDDDDLFSGVDRLANLTVPLSMTPFGLLAVRDPLTHRRGKDDQKKALKRKKTCDCICNCQETDKPEQPSTSKETPKDAITESEVLPPAKKTKFEVNLNVGTGYKPGELKVKLAPDNRSLIVQGCHEESHKSDAGYSKVSSQIYQRILLPKDVDLEGLKCDLDVKGVMCISAPKILPALEEQEKVRQIPVNITGNNGEKEKCPSICIEGNKETLAQENEVAAEQVDSTA